MLRRPQQQLWCDHQRIPTNFWMVMSHTHMIRAIWVVALDLTSLDRICDIQPSNHCKTDNGDVTSDVQLALEMKRLLDVMWSAGSELFLSLNNQPALNLNVFGGRTLYGVDGHVLWQPALAASTSKQPRFINEGVLSFTVLRASGMGFHINHMCLEGKHKLFWTCGFALRTWYSSHHLQQSTTNIQLALQLSCDSVIFNPISGKQHEALLIGSVLMKMVLL